MKSVLDFLNNNPGFVAILGVVIGWALSSVSDRKLYKRQKRDALDKERRDCFAAKAELSYNRYFEDRGDNVERIEIVLCSYEPFLDKSGNVCVRYPRRKLRNSVPTKKYYYFENTGRSDINELEIATADPKYFAIIPKDSLKIYTENKIVGYSVSLGRKIRRGMALEIVVNFFGDRAVVDAFSSVMEIYYRDSLGNNCRQAFFLGEEKITEPFPTNPKERFEKTNIEANLRHWKRRLNRGPFVSF